MRVDVCGYTVPNLEGVACQAERTQPGNGARLDRREARVRAFTCLDLDEGVRITPLKPDDRTLDRHQVLFVVDGVAVVREHGRRDDERRHCNQGVANCHV